MAQPQKSSDGIRILSVVWFKVLPPKFGGQKGVALFNEYLGRLASLTCLCSADNEILPASYAIDNRLPVGKSQVLNPFCWRKIYLAAKKQKATHLILEFPYYGIAGLLCKSLLGLKLIVHSHNIEGLRFKEQKKWWWKALYSYEKWTFQKADAAFFKTEKDRALAIEHFGLARQKTTVIPYGIVPLGRVDKEAAKKILFQRHSIVSGTKLLLFAATLDYGPNADAMKTLAQQVAPLLKKSGLVYKIFVCGRIVYKSFFYLKNLAAENFLYVGNVPDIETYYTAADVFLNPVTIGGGVQTKVVDALNHHLNVVLFKGMDEGLEEARDKIFSVPKTDWESFTDAVIEALKKDSPTSSSFFCQNDWTNIAQKAYGFIQTI